jgi:hypothetical protein
MSQVCIYPPPQAIVLTPTSSDSKSTHSTHHVHSISGSCTTSNGAVVFALFKNVRPFIHAGSSLVIAMNGSNPRVLVADRYDRLFSCLLATCRTMGPTQESLHRTTIVLAGSLSSAIELIIVYACQPASTVSCSRYDAIAQHPSPSVRLPLNIPGVPGLLHSRRMYRIVTISRSGYILSVRGSCP